MDPTSDDAFLLRLARRLIGDRHLAEDAAQDAWVVALRRNGGVRARRRFLSGVVRHLSIDVLRAQERRRAHEAALPRGDAAPSTDEVVHRAGVRAAVAASLEALPRRYREVLRLRYYEGVPPREIARRLGVPVETVRTRTRRGLARLRARLGGDEGGESVLGALPLGVVGRARAARDLMSRLVRAALPSRFGVALVPAGCLLSLALVAPHVFERSGVVEPPPEVSQRAPGGVTLHAAYPLPPRGSEGGALWSWPAPSDGRAAVSVEGAPPARVPPDAGARRLSGRVLDRDSRLVPGARVEARAEDGAVAAAVTDASGRWAFDDLPPSFRVVAWTDGTRSLFDLGAHALPHGAFDAGDLVLFRTTALEGVVLDAEGAPLADAVVRAWPECGQTRSGEATLFQDGRLETETDADGRFHFEGVPRVRWTLVADRAPLASAWCRVEPGEQPVELRLARGAVARVRVVDRAGNPIAGARVGCWREFTRGWDDPPVGVPWPVSEEATAPDGTCRFEGRLPEKPLLFLVSAPGYATTYRGLVHAPCDVEVMLEEARTLRGTMTGPDGEPVAGGEVVVRPELDFADLAGGFDLFVDRVGVSGRAVTDARGRFALAVGPGPVELLASSDGEGGLDVASATAGAGQDDVELVVGELPRTHGSVVAESDDRPLATATLTVRSASLGVQRDLLAGGDGSFRLALPPADDWLLVAREPSLAAAVVPLRAGELVRVELRERRSLAVRVVDRAGRPVPEATVLLHDRAGAPLVAQGWEGRFANAFSVGPDGGLDVDGLPAGPIRCSVSVPWFFETRPFDLDLAGPGRHEATLRLDALDSGVEGACLDLRIVLDHAAGEPRAVEGAEAGAGAYGGMLRVEVSTPDGRPFLNLSGSVERGRFRPERRETTLSFGTGKGGRLRRFSRADLPTGPAAYAASAVFDDPHDPLGRLPVPASGGRVVVQHDRGAPVVLEVPDQRGGSGGAPVRTLLLPRE